MRDTVVMRWIALLPVVAVLGVAKAQTPDADLLKAVDKNDPSGLKAALKAGAEVNSPQGPTALFKAVDYKDDEKKACVIVKTLLDRGADINAKGPDGQSVLLYVLEGRAICSADIAILLADYHPDITVRGDDGSCVVAMALGRGPAYYTHENDPYYCARKYIEAGAAPDEPNHKGITPLMTLAQGSVLDNPSPIDFVKFLLSKGADSERKDKQGKSAIDRAVAGGDYDLLLLLDAKGAHRDAYPQAEKRKFERQLATAVAQACTGKGEALKTAAMLIKEGADPNASPDADGQTIFGTVLRESTSRQFEVVTWLLDHGADPNKPMADGTIPLELSVHQPAIFALLQARGAKLSRNLQLAQKASPAEIEDIQEAVFHHQMGDNASGQQQRTGAYFLEVTDSKTGQQIDPSPAFLKRFAGHKPRVAAVSQCTASADKGVRDKKTGEEGLIFSVDDIYWISKTQVRVGGGYYEAGLSASGNTYTLEKKDGKWVVVKDVMNWIS